MAVPLGLQLPLPPGGPAVSTALLVAAGGVAGLGVWLLVAAAAGWEVIPWPVRQAGLRPDDQDGRSVPDGHFSSGSDHGSEGVFGAVLPAAWRRTWPTGRRLRLAAIGGLALGVAAAGLLQLPVLAVLAAGVVWVALEGARGASVPELNARGAAVAAWCETVRQELDAGQPQRAALIAACDMPPAGLEAPLARLAERLQATPVPQALWAFARDVDHPAAGGVVAALDVAYRMGAADLPRLMAGQVETTRHQVQMLREVHAARAKHRRSMVLLLALFAASIMGLFLVWPDFLVAYRDLPGQLILGGIGAGVLLAVRAFMRLSQPSLPPTFFTHHTDPTAAELTRSEPTRSEPTRSAAPADADAAGAGSPRAERLWPPVAGADLGSDYGSSFGSGGEGRQR